MAELLEAGRRRHPTADLRHRAIDKITEIDTRIADLTAIRAALTDIVDARCDSLTNCTCADCPIPFLTIGTAARPSGDPEEPAPPAATSSADTPAHQHPAVDNAPPRRTEVTGALAAFACAACCAIPLLSAAGG